MESKLDGILSLLGQSVPPRGQIRQPEGLSTPSPLSPLPSAQASYDRIACSEPFHATTNSHTRELKELPSGESFESHPTTITGTSKQPISDDGASDASADSFQVVIGESLTRPKADTFLLAFRDMTSWFPFVIVPPDATALSMSRERPFLFMATMASASSADKSLRGTLERELRETLSRRIILDGEKNLDLLQGLLVYLAWFVPSLIFITIAMH